MFSRLKCISTVPFCIGSAVVALLCFLLPLSPRFVRALGYTGEQSLYAFDSNLSSQEAAYLLLSDYGESGRRACVIVHVLPDVICPVAYMLSFHSALTLMKQEIDTVTKLWNVLIFLPWIAGSSDLLENAAITTMALRYPSRPGLFLPVKNV